MTAKAIEGTMNTARPPRTLKWPLVIMVIGAIAVAIWWSLDAMGVSAYPFYASAALLASLLVILMPARRPAPPPLTHFASKRGSPSSRRPR
jgi:hypothetical protein